MGLYGFSRPSENNGSKEVAMNGRPEFKGEAIQLVKLSPLEKILFSAMSGISYALGYVVGTMRYRVFKRLNLFQILSSMSRGLAAAMPKEGAGEKPSGT